MVVAEQYFDEFDRGMIDRGFTMTEDDDHGTLIYARADHRKVEVLPVQDDPNDTLLGPEADPDYDVNLLAYNGERFYDWAAPDPFHDLAEIYRHIKQKIAVSISPREARVEKIKRKGYTIAVQQES